MVIASFLKNVSYVRSWHTAEKHVALEVPYGGRYADNRNLEKCQMTADQVNSILDAVDEEFERQQHGLT